MAKVGDRIGEWTLRRFLGDGGQGQVFAGTKEEGAEEVAIKLVKAIRPKKRARFIREIQVHASLSAKGVKNVIPLFHHNLDALGDGAPQGFIVMPLARSTLADHRALLTKRIEFCLEIFSGILRGIQEAHQSGIVHRDLKPSNILFADDTLSTPLIADFGICLLRDTADDERLTEIGETVGAKFFMAPEQERGGIADIQPTADIYALGKLLHHILTGRYLYREELDDAFTPEELEIDPRYKLILDRILRNTIVAKAEGRIQNVVELIKIVEHIRKSGNDPGGHSTPDENGPNLKGDPTKIPTANPQDSELFYFRHFSKEIVAGHVMPITLEFDGLRRTFTSAWANIHESIRKQPGAGKHSAIKLIDSQASATGLMFAIARCNAESLLQHAKRLLEHILRASEHQSGYPAVFTIPHLQVGYYYMGMTTISLHFENWECLTRLLTEKFEWYYQSGRPIFSRGFSLSYLFHPEALQRSAPNTHDFYRELLGNSPIVGDMGLEGEALLDAYLQNQFLMSLLGAQALERGEDAPLWPDFGRFHGYRVEPLLDRIYHNHNYAKHVLALFSETKEQFFERLNGRLTRLAKRIQGSNYFWDSIEEWEPRPAGRR